MRLREHFCGGKLKLGELSHMEEGGVAEESEDGNRSTEVLWTVGLYAM